MNLMKSWERLEKSKGKRRLRNRKKRVKVGAGATVVGQDLEHLCVIQRQGRWSI